MGAVAPHTRPAWLLVNGEAERLVALTEHVGTDFLTRRYGHGDRRIPTTAIVVQTLQPDWLIELEIIAAS